MSGNDSDGGHIQLPTSMKSEKTKCSICREEGDGFHFGAEACRACAAFFRRSISLGKKYVCRTNGNCQITANIRCMCRACRYSKCIEVGMNPAGVQQRRDTIGKRLTPMSPDSIDPLPLVSALLSIKQEDEPSSSSPAPSCVMSSAEAMPILERMHLNYSRMENSRVVIHRREGESLFMTRIPRNLTYKEAAVVTEKEVSLVVDWVACCFDDFAKLPCDQKRVLFRNFFMNFTILQCAYFSHINNREDVLILASGDYIDMKNLQNFYHDIENPEASQVISPEEAAKLFQQSFDLYRRSVIHPMIQQKVDVYEFFALCTCALWDFGLDEQTDECIEVGNNVKEKVLKELLFYLQNIRKVEDPPIRIAMLVTILPAMHRSMRKFQEDIEISNVFNIYPPTDQFYNIMSGKFF